MEKEKNEETSRSELIQKAHIKANLKYKEIIDRTEGTPEQDRVAYEKIAENILSVLDGVDIFCLNEEVWADKGCFEKDTDSVVIWNMEDLEVFLERFSDEGYEFKDDSYTPPEKT